VAVHAAFATFRRSEPTQESGGGGTARKLLTIMRAMFNPGELFNEELVSGAKKAEQGDR
jgi:hypothetical protein